MFTSRFWSFCSPRADDAVTGDDGRQRYLYPAVAMFREAPQAPPTIAERVAEREAAKAAGK